MTALVADAHPATWRDTFARLFTLAWPIVLARIGIMTMGLVDTVVVGRFSARELGYHALGWAPTNIMLTGSIGLLVGVQVMAARRIGEGSPGRTGAVLRRGLVYALALGAIFTLALAVSGGRLMQALGLEADLARGSGRAMQVFALSMVPYLIGCVLSFWLEGLGRPKPGMTAIWAANVVNLALNLLLVPGSLGLPAGGAVGAGWATLGARTFYMLWLAIHVWRMRDSRALGVFDRPPAEPEAAREQRRIGYGAGASYLVEAGAFLGMTVVAGWLGTLPVGVWSIVINFSALVFMIPLGLAGATAVLVGNAYGAQDPRGVVRATLAGSGTVLGIALAISLGVALTPGLIAGAYATDPALVAATAAALALATPFFAPDALQAVLAQALRARGDVLVPTILHVLAYAVVMLPLGWWLAHPQGRGVAGCVEAVIVASFLAAAMLVARFAWVTLRGRPARPAA